MNVCCFTGTLGQDWKVEYNNDGKPRAKTSMAIRKYNGDTMWINLVAFGKRCDTLSQYTKKGDKLPVSCELDVNIHESDGKKTYYHNFIVQGFTLVGKKSDSGQQQGQSSNGQGNFQQQAPAQQNGFQQQPQQQNNNQGFQGQQQGEFQGPPSDDLPF